ncbi:MAG: amidohydrolase [Acidobacteriota bacterium]|nr:amidohydrolase [Blastocatellia bacterium]MDW8240226.1 amidohydrolase [Acidobacteriota bacterium]
MNKSCLIAILIVCMLPQSVVSQRAAATEQIARLVEAMKDKLVATRRDFHMYPELSNREERTARVIAERLRQLGLQVKTGVAKHGVVALLKGDKPGPVVAYRADMDALPIEETIDVPYKSRHPGVKHACGHDVHMTIGLGVAEVLSQMKSYIPGTIKFLFQPAEEGPPAGEEGGALLMIKEGALENPRPSAIFGLHVMPLMEVGTIGYNVGPVMASADRFTITIRGKKVHGAYPHEGIDAVVVAAHAVVALQTIRSRRTNTQDPIVLTIGSIQGGNRFNIISDEVKLEGTVRTLNEQTRSMVEQMIHQTLKGVTESFGASYTMSYIPGAAVTINDPQLGQQMLPTVRRVVGLDRVFSSPPQMGSEDFSYLAREVPGFFFFLGVGNKAKGITAMIHTPEFDVDEDSLLVGTKVAANLLLDYLEQTAK